MFSISFNLDQSIRIDKSLEDVFETVADFSSWKEWSPWLCQERDCSVEIEGQRSMLGHKQSWNGKRIGEGSMELIAKSDNKELEYRIDFIKPWKSTSEVHFFFKEIDGLTEVTWTMKGSLPIFLFFMKPMMKALITMDYKRGLSMLKDLVEEGEVHTDTDIKGVSNKDPFYYLGIKRQCSIDEMPELMTKDINELNVKYQTGILEEADELICLYHKYDFVKSKCEYTVAFAYKNRPDENHGFENGRIDAHKRIQVVHTGPYKHLGNAWMTAMSFQRAEKAKINKSLPMYEIYLNNPEKVAEKEIRTEIGIPVQ